MLLIAAAGLVVWFHFFTVRTTGELQPDRAHLTYYPLLVDGFRKGQLSLNWQPDPRLVALPDPYDPALNRDLRLGDASYFHGRYYLYFGVTPAAVLLLPYALIAGHNLPQAAAVLIFGLVGVFAATWVWLSLRRRYFHDSAWWLPAVAVLALGLGSHVLALDRRPWVWEVPIASAFAFLMLTLWAAERAIHGRRPVATLAWAGLCLGLAVGSRPTALLAIGALVVPIWYLRRDRPEVNWRRGAFAAAATLGLILLGLAWYNYARFGSPFEFGVKYQLSSMREGAASHLNPRFIPYNLRVYFLWPVRWTADWPFIGSRPLPPWPSGYFSGEELYCLAWLSPLLWFAVAGGLMLRRGRDRVVGGFVTVVAVMLAILIPIGGLMLCFFYAAERYMVDFVPMTMLLAWCGVLIVERAARSPKGRRMVHAAVAVTAAVTIIVGVLASFDYHQRSMKDTDPSMWHRIANWTEPPIRTVERWIGKP